MFFEKGLTFFAQTLDFFHFSVPLYCLSVQYNYIISFPRITLKVAIKYVKLSLQYEIFLKFAQALTSSDTFYF